MAKPLHSIQVKNNAEQIGNTIAAIAAHFETAPDDDPAKRAMLAFGEIDAKRDLETQTWFEDGVVHVRLSLSPELQAIADMVTG